MHFFAKPCKASDAQPGQEDLFNGMPLRRILTSSRFARWLPAFVICQHTLNILVVLAHDDPCYYLTEFASG